MNEDRVTLRIGLGSPAHARWVCDKCFLLSYVQEEDGGGVRSRNWHDLPVRTPVSPTAT